MIGQQVLYLETNKQIRENKRHNASAETVLFELYNLTHLCRVDSPTLTPWTDLSGVKFLLYIHVAMFYRNTCV